MQSEEERLIAEPACEHLADALTLAQMLPAIVFVFSRKRCSANAQKFTAPACCPVCAAADPCRPAFGSPMCTPREPMALRHYFSHICWCEGVPTCPVRNPVCCRPKAVSITM